MANDAAFATAVRRMINQETHQALVMMEPAALREMRRRVENRFGRPVVVGPKGESATLEEIRKYIDGQTSTLAVVFVNEKRRPTL